jgi:hypothetical protein
LLIWAIVMGSIAVVGVVALVGAARERRRGPEHDEDAPPPAR